MKKTSLLLALVTMLSSHLYAQSFGIAGRAGLNVSTLWTDDNDLEDWGPIVGPHIGGFGSYMFTENIGIEAGLMYTEAGFFIEFYDSFSGDYERYNYNLNYLAVPFSARFKWGYFTLNPGLQMAFLLSAKLEEEDISDITTSSDFSVFVTPGVELPMGLTLGTTFNIGTTNLLKDPGSNSYTNFVVQFSVGYRFSPE